MISLTLKSWLSLPLVILACLQLFTMLELLGRPDKRFDSQKLRRAHRTVGWVAFVWLLAIAFLCLFILRASGGDMTPRGAAHALTAALLLALLTVKISIVGFYRKLFSFVAPFGFTVFVLVLTTVTLSAGAYLIGSTHGGATARSEDEQGLGQRVFAQKCAGCHYSDREEAKIGPGLGGIFRSGVLPSSGRPATRENIRAQLNTPYQAMPSFADLSEREKEAVVDFLLQGP